MTERLSGILFRRRMYIEIGNLVGENDVYTGEIGLVDGNKKNSATIRKTDAGIAKNYLTEDEIKLLGLLVEQ